jgi:hypothetical protein
MTIRRGQQERVGIKGKLYRSTERPLEPNTADKPGPGFEEGQTTTSESRQYQTATQNVNDGQSGDQGHRGSSETPPQVSEPSIPFVVYSGQNTKGLGGVTGVIVTDDRSKQTRIQLHSK